MTVYGHVVEEGALLQADEDVIWVLFASGAEALVVGV